MPTATIIWTPSASTDVVGHEVHRGLGSTGLILLTTVGNVLTYVDASVPNVSQNVSYGVKAVDGAGNKSPMSNVITQAVDVTPPQAPVIQS
jgi:hypothetical protein